MDLGVVLADLNWLAIIVGAVAAYALGALWYSQKMFGAMWMRGSGASGAHKHPMMWPMLAQAVGTFLFALVVGITEKTDDLIFAIIIILTVATLIKAQGLFAGKSHAAVAVESGFILAMGLVFILAHVIL